MLSTSPLGCLLLGTKIAIKVFFRIYPKLSPDSRLKRRRGHKKKKEFYSNSIVEGGLSVMSYKHLTTVGISVVIRLEILSSRS